jgi:hypothetical protein
MKGATDSSLTVAIGAGDGNSPATLYVIQETNSGNYVQASGALGATAVYQTAAVWGTKNVTGLSHATTYAFRAKAQNGAGTDTAFGPAASGTTFAALVVLAGWDMSAQSGGGTSPLAASQANANLTVGGLTRGAGVNVSEGAAKQAWGGNAWNSATETAAITANKFATTTFTPKAGSTVSFASISEFDYRSSTNIINGTLQYSTDGITFNDITNVAYTSNSGNGASIAVPIDLSGIAALQNVPSSTTVTLRLVNYGATSSSSTWYIYDKGTSTNNDFEISGYVTSISTTAVFSTLTTSPVITSGATAVTLAGKVSAGSIYPADGETVLVTINGSTQSATITGGAGGFSVNYPTATLPPAATAYAITYHYAGDASLQAAADDVSTTLTVNGLKAPNLAYTIAPTVPLVITLADLQASGLASSQGSPVYSIIGLGTNNTSGTVITNSVGTMLKYTYPASATPASDSFSYTASDGTASANGTVTITFASVAGPQLTAVTDGHGWPVISFHGLPGYSYHIQRATTLTPPDWTAQEPGVAVPAGGDGSATWTDTNLPIPSPAYYRLSYP